MVVRHVKKPTGSIAKQSNTPSWQLINQAHMKVQPRHQHHMLRCHIHHLPELRLQSLNHSFRMREQLFLPACVRPMIVAVAILARPDQVPVVTSGLPVVGDAVQPDEEHVLLAFAFEEDNVRRVPEGELLCEVGPGELGESVDSGGFVHAHGVVLLAAENVEPCCTRSSAL
jgi:hypothetical protein